MRVKALILLFPLTIFLIETVSFSTQVNTMCKKMSCMEMMGKMNCSGKKDGCEKPDRKSNNSSSACSICPVCSIFVFQPRYLWSVQNNVPKRNYQLLNTGHVSSFAPDIWKPPNNYLLNS